MTNDSVAAHRELKAEADRILPELVGRLWGNGSLHLDTDSMDLDDERDFHHLEWLARVVAGFVLRDRQLRESNHPEGGDDA